MSDTARRNKRIMTAIVGVLGATAIFVPVLGVLLIPGGLSKNSETSVAAPTTTKPPLTIKPLPVRPVLTAFVIKPEDCPPPAIGAPPDQPLRICDITRTAVYELAPESMRIQLTDVDSFKNPLNGNQTVQFAMTNESSKEFSKYTAEHVGQQTAFVRAGIVVWAPRIPEPIEGTVLQLTGELTPEQSEQVAKMLRDNA